MTLSEQLKSLVEKATPGPWANDPCVTIYGQDDLPCVVDQHRLVVAQCLDDGHTVNECTANASLIVTLVNNLPTILAALEAVENTHD